MKKLQIFLGFCFIFFVSTLKTEAQIKGYVADKENKAIYFANITLLNATDSTLVSSTSSDENGNFQIISSKKGFFILNISHIAYKIKTINIKIETEGQLISLNQIALESADIQLGEAVVKSSKPTFIKENDRLIFNVETSTLLSTQTNASELLNKLPGIWIDRQNNISLNGQKNIQLTINGRNTYLAGNDLMQMLRSIPANTIEKVEIIYNPDSKYGADGVAVINIKTKSKVNSGFNGNLTTLIGSSVGYGDFYPRHNSGINLTLGTKKVSLFSNYSYGYEKSLRNINENLTFPSSTLNQSIRLETSPEITHNLQTGLEYSLNQKQTIRFFYNKNYTNSITDQINSILLTKTEKSNTDITSNSKETLRNNQDAFNFEYLNQIDSTKTLKLGSDYLLLDKGQYASYDNNFLYPDYSNTQQLLKNNAETGIRVWVNNLDFTQQISSANSIEAGLKYSDVKTRNLVDFEEFDNNKWIEDNIRSNAFNYTEKLFASYLNWKANFKKIDLTAGLRYENAQIEGNSRKSTYRFERSFKGLFPSLSLGYAATEKIDLGFYYSRRIKRPGYIDINPYINYVNPFTALEGNPDLVPSITDKLQVNMQFQKMYSASLTYYHTNNFFTTAQFQNVENQTQRLMPTNIGKLSNIELNLGIPLGLASWWESYFDVSLIHQRYIESKTVNLGFAQNSRFTLQFYSQQSFSLPKGISLEFTNTLVTPSIDGQFSFATIYTFSVGAKKSFFEKKLDVKIGANDFLRTMKYVGNLSGIGWSSVYQDVKDWRQINVSLNYNFNNNSKVKSKSPKWISDEEKKRMK